MINRNELQWEIHEGIEVRRQDLSKRINMMTQSYFSNENFINNVEVKEEEIEPMNSCCKNPEHVLIHDELTGEQLELCLNCKRYMDEMEAEEFGKWNQETPEFELHTGREKVILAPTLDIISNWNKADKELGKKLW